MNKYIYIYMIPNPLPLTPPQKNDRGHGVFFPPIGFLLGDGILTFTLRCKPIVGGFGADPIGAKNINLQPI